MANAPSINTTTAGLADLNENNCLEYGFLKIPYELLNKKFRATQKIIDQHNYYFKKELSTLEGRLKATNDAISVSEIAQEAHKFGEILKKTQSEMEKGCSDEIAAAEMLRNRAEYLRDSTASESAEESFRRQRVNRFVIEHLLRAGYFSTAQKLADYANVDYQCSQQIFHVAEQVEDSLAQRDLSICLNWVIDNRSKLHRLNSMFEIEVRIQQCIELIRSGRRMDAVSYVRSYFSTLPRNQWGSNLLNLMGLLGFGAASNMEKYKQLFNYERYDTLAEMFRQENQRIFQLSTQSPFSACLHAGIAAYKTPYCRKTPGSKCVICDDMMELAEGLPVAHASNSRLICAATGDPINEENQPLMLPNGRVYGEKAMKQMTKDKEVRCPRTNECFALEDVKRVFVL